MNTRKDQMLELKRNSKTRTRTMYKKNRDLNQDGRRFILSSETMKKKFLLKRCVKDSTSGTRVIINGKAGQFQRKQESYS
jgi:hypothetical protein